MQRFFACFSAQKALLAVHRTNEWVHAGCVNSLSLAVLCVRCEQSIDDLNDAVTLVKKGKFVKLHSKCVPKRKNVEEDTASGIPLCKEAKGPLSDDKLQAPTTGLKKARTSPNDKHVEK